MAIPFLFPGKHVPMRYMKKKNKYSASLWKHKYAKHTEVRYVCEVCNARFVSREFLRQHENTHNDPPRYVCADCGKRFVKHTGEMFTCDTCNKTFDRREHLTRHIETHQENKECEHCKKKMFHLPEHQKVCKKLTRKPSYICEVLGKKVFERACRTQARNSFFIIRIRRCPIYHLHVSKQLKSANI